MNLSLRFLFFVLLGDKDKWVYDISDESKFGDAHENQVNEPPNIRRFW